MDTRINVVGSNPYGNYSPQDLIRAWRVQESSVQGTATSIAKALRKRSEESQEGARPIGVAAAIQVLEDNLEQLRLIYDVAMKQIAEVRNCCCGQDKPTVIAYTSAVLETSLSVGGLAVTIHQAKQDEADRNAWIPFGLVAVGAFASIVKDFFWAQKTQIETVYANLELTIQPDALKFVQGLIDGLKGMQALSVETGQPLRPKDAERNVRAIGHIPLESTVPVKLMLEQVKSGCEQSAQHGKRLSALVTVLERRMERAEQRQTAGFDWRAEMQKSQVPDELWNEVVQANCCGWDVDVGELQGRANQLRRNLEAHVQATAEGGGADCEVLLGILEEIKQTGGKNVVAIVNRFLDQESQWLSRPISKAKAQIRTGIQALSYLTTLVLLGVTAYKESQEEGSSRTLSIVSSVAIVASVTIGRLNDWLYQRMIQQKHRSNDLRFLRNHVVKTMELADSLEPFFAELHRLNQKENPTASDKEGVITAAAQVPGRFGRIARAALADAMRKKQARPLDGVDPESKLGKRLDKLLRENPPVGGDTGANVNEVVSDLDWDPTMDTHQGSLTQPLRTAVKMQRLGTKRDVELPPDSDEEIGVIDRVERREAILRRKVRFQGHLTRENTLSDGEGSQSDYEMEMEQILRREAPRQEIESLEAAAATVGTETETSTHFRRDGSPSSPTVVMTLADHGEITEAPPRVQSQLGRLDLESPPPSPGAAPPLPEPQQGVVALIPENVAPPQPQVGNQRRVGNWSEV